jgi:hypothetical protein
MTAPSPRKVVFITLEMAPRQLLTRLALALIYAAARARGAQPALERRQNPTTRDEAIPKKPTDLIWIGSFQYMANSGQALEGGNISVDKKAAKDPIRSWRRI